MTDRLKTRDGSAYGWKDGTDSRNRQASGVGSATFTDRERQYAGRHTAEPNDEIRPVVVREPLKKMPYQVDVLEVFPDFLSRLDEQRNSKPGLWEAGSAFEGESIGSERYRRFRNAIIYLENSGMLPEYARLPEAMPPVLNAGKSFNRFTQQDMRQTAQDAQEIVRLIDKKMRYGKRFIPSEKAASESGFWATYGGDLLQNIGSGGSEFVGGVLGLTEIPVELIRDIRRAKIKAAGWVLDKSADGLDWIADQVIDKIAEMAGWNHEQRARLKDVYAYISPSRLLDAVEKLGGIPASYEDLFRLIPAVDEWLGDDNLLGKLSDEAYEVSRNLDERGRRNGYVMDENGNIREVTVADLVKEGEYGSAVGQYFLDKGHDLVTDAVEVGFTAAGMPGVGSVVNNAVGAHNKFYEMDTDPYNTMTKSEKVKNAVLTGAIDTGVDLGLGKIARYGGGAGRSSLPGNRNKYIEWMKEKGKERIQDGLGEAAKYVGEEFIDYHTNATERPDYGKWPEKLFEGAFDARFQGREYIPSMRDLEYPYHYYVTPTHNRPVFVSSGSYGVPEERTDVKKSVPVEVKKPNPVKVKESVPDTVPYDNQLLRSESPVLFQVEPFQPQFNGDLLEYAQRISRNHLPLKKKRDKKERRS